MERLDRIWRIFGTGASFALFGLGSLVLGVLIFPVLAIALPSERRQRAAQRVIHYTFRAFRGFMRLVGVVEAHVVNPERFDRRGGMLIVANHPSLIDYVLIAAVLPQLDCVVKRSHWTNPATFGVVRGAGYVANDTGPETLEACAERLRAGRNLLLFPEGTRSPRGELGHFQRGAAHLALETGCDAVPVTIRCVPPGLGRGQPWWDVPPRRMRFTLEVGEPLATPRDDRPRAQAARSLTRTYREHFAKALGLQGPAGEPLHREGALTRQDS